MLKSIRQVGLFLAKSEIFFYSLIWLMVLVTVGTIAQKYIGLYQAQADYFASMILWVGFVPLPGGMFTMAVMFVNLLAKLIFASPWRWPDSGVIIVHVSVLFLLFGGFLTVISSQEGRMTIYEGESSNYLEEYNKKEVVIDSDVDEKDIFTFALEGLDEGEILSSDNLPFTLEIIKACENCDVSPRGKDSVSKELKGAAQMYDMKAIALAKESHENLAGVMLKVSGAGVDQDGIYLVVERLKAVSKITLNGKTYHFHLRDARTYLPFRIELVDFEKQLHPGTGMARSYKSDIILFDEGMQWPSVVQMNEPLRYKGFTFYQSSFIDGGEREATIFSVVKNFGRLFPYISSIIMCIGLLIHMLIYLPKLVSKT